MLDPYQHLPEYLNPIALSIGSFSIKWYSLGYIIGFITVYLLLAYRIKKKENLFAINKNQLGSPLIYLIIGLLIGARLGYVIFYDFQHFSNNPLEIFWPFKNSFHTGLVGMSYFGGLLGTVLAGAIFAKKNRIDFWQLADFVVPAVPAGYFFGRIGNFLNGELYGRITDKPWGMYFPADPLVLRHPSQLYEAFFEGMVLFLILWFLRNKETVVSGQLLSVYLFFYGFFRFFVEFFREPDIQMGLFFDALTLGQIFSLILIFLSVFLWYNLKKENRPAA